MLRASRWHWMVILESAESLLQWVKSMTSSAPFENRESADSNKFWVYLLRAKIGPRHCNDLIDLTIIDGNIKIGNGKSDSVCRSVIESDPAATTGVVELVARARSGGRAGLFSIRELVQLGNSHFPLQALCLFVKGADTRAFWKKLSISVFHHSPGSTFDAAVAFYGVTFFFLRRRPSAQYNLFSSRTLHSIVHW